MTPDATLTTPRTDKTSFGFWVYVMTDCVLFATLFATYAVLRNATADGPTGRDIFTMPYVLTETLLLLTSSFTSGLMLRAATKQRLTQTLVWLGITFALGLSFVVMEIAEFAHLVADGHGWQTSAFLSGFFTLVGTHGLHITVGLLWIVVMGAFLLRRGLNEHTMRRLQLFSIFWHFLDVVWVFIFTIVFLMGVA
jgi:cytochrome o ubiquinol oxidase subunit III